MDEAGTQVYRAYMLRLRRTDGTHPAWLASLQEVATGERYTFPSLDEMLVWLKEQIGERAEAQGTQRRSETGDAPRPGPMVNE
jgi:hypothetical protein